MISKQELYTFSKECSELQHSCYKNVNRILEKMTQYPECCSDLELYTKQCLVMSKLCDYLCNCCCNAECISSHSLKELKSKCKNIKKSCNMISKKLPKECSVYIRCDSIPKLCNKLDKY